MPQLQEHDSLNDPCMECHQKMTTKVTTDFVAGFRDWVKCTNEKCKKFGVCFPRYGYLVLLSEMEFKNVKASQT